MTCWCGLPGAARAQAPAVTAFEGARLIVGDGSAPIENGTLVVEGARIVQAGRAADVRVPAGATRVNLAGKTVMPDLIDTHTHLSQTREALTQDLKRRAYYGVSAALSMGTDETDAELDTIDDKAGLDEMRKGAGKMYGAAFVASKIDAIAANPKVWAKTAFILDYDENDGIFDHVVPPVPPSDTPHEFVLGQPIGAGFRVPCIIVSPWTAGGWVCSEPFDHTSALHASQLYSEMNGVPR
jgi:hypothetical protein